MYFLYILFNPLSTFFFLYPFSRIISTQFSRCQNIYKKMIDKRHLATIFTLNLLTSEFEFKVKDSIEKLMENKWNEKFKKKMKKKRFFVKLIIYYFTLPARFIFFLLSFSLYFRRKITS